MNNNRVMRFRKLANLTQVDMANELGIYRTTYTQKENGKAEFTESEIVKSFELIKNNLPEEYKKIKIEDIFFKNIVAQKK